MLLSSDRHSILSGCSNDEKIDSWKAMYQACNDRWDDHIEHLTSNSIQSQNKYAGGLESNNSTMIWRMYQSQVLDSVRLFRK